MPKNKSTNFLSIEEDVESDHLRPYYKWASRSTHASSIGLDRRVENPPNANSILTGQSVYGIADPGNLTAISLYAITKARIDLINTINADIDGIILLKLVRETKKQFKLDNSPFFNSSTKNR